MLEKIKKSVNQWYLHSLGVMLVAIAVVLKGHIEISFALYSLSIVLAGIGSLWNQNKEQMQKLDKILDNQIKAKDE